MDHRSTFTSSTKIFVQAKEYPWLDEQTYQELFALCQGLPGPASTKFIFIVVLLRFGLACAGLAFLLWAAPGAAGIFSLSLGVQRMSEILPEPVYAFLSGLKVSTVGVGCSCGHDFCEQQMVWGACCGLHTSWRYTWSGMVGSNPDLTHNFKDASDP